jgi:hypothetical protein
MATTQITQTSCPKCSGTGFIAALAHVKNGLCFDCNGEGVLAVVITGNANLKSARLVGQAVLDGKAVAPADIAKALAYFEGIGPCAWRTQDYGFRNALVAVA